MLNIFELESDLNKWLWDLDQQGWEVFRFRVISIDSNFYGIGIFYMDSLLKDFIYVGDFHDVVEIHYKDLVFEVSKEKSKNPEEFLNPQLLRYFLTTFINA